MERLYRDRALTPAFQIGPRAQPADLDDRLDRAGYRLVLTTLVLTVAAEDVLAKIAATGRLALDGEWGGLAGVAVRDDARRRGHATTIIRALLEATTVRRVRPQVVADNAPASGWGSPRPRSTTTACSKLNDLSAAAR
ncbi:GNAT family N-acetyltransferase [Amycolatopsis minnesotensis]|uniref:N-acetyltransferase domain-containing protein n=1 Tax=Amycolatopsis minnesotensis TaxID=337894 RepID=A0ABN2QH52_9PSEU